MKKMLITLVAISLSSASFAVQSSQQSKKMTKKQISGLIATKSCLQARSNLFKNGWKSVHTNRIEEESESQQAFLKKYPDLDYCQATGYGECYGSYKRGNQYLMVTYLAEGSQERFESSYCGTGEFKLSNSPF